MRETTVLSTLKLVVGARNRTYPIPCSKTIPEPIPEPVPEPIPKAIPELILELTAEPIPELILKLTPELIPVLTPEPIPESAPKSIQLPESAPDLESAPDSKLTWESHFAPGTESGLIPEMELAQELESVIELK